MIWLLFDWQVGNHIDVATGKWTALDSGIGGGIDSYFEYLVKGAIMFDIPELLEHFRGKIPEFFLKDHEYSFHLFTTSTQDFVLIYGEKKYFLIEKATWVIFMYFFVLE